MTKLKTTTPPSSNTVKVFGTTMPSWLYSLGMSTLGALAFGVSLYVAARFADIVSRPLMYHGIIYGAFFGLYMVMPGGFEKHFNVPVVKKRMDVADVAYYTIVVHSTAGFGDIYPTSFWARSVVTAHLSLVFLATAGLLKLGQ